MEKKELKKRIVEYVGKNISYGYGDCSFQIDYTSPDGVEHIYEEDDTGDINPTFMEFLEDFALDVIQQEIDRAREDTFTKQDYKYLLSEVTKSLDSVAGVDKEMTDYHKSIIKKIEAKLARIGV